MWAATENSLSDEAEVPTALRDAQATGCSVEKRSLFRRQKSSGSDFLVERQTEMNFSRSFQAARDCVLGSASAERLSSSSDHAGMQLYAVSSLSVTEDGGASAAAVVEGGTENVSHMART